LPDGLFAFHFCRNRLAYPGPTPPEPCERSGLFTFHEASWFISSADLGVRPPSDPWGAVPGRRGTFPKGALMTKADIVQAVYTKLGGFSKKESADLVDLVFETMKETLGRGEKIKISGFGNFVLRDKRQRQGRNPQTGDPIVITARRVLNFKASQLLKQALNDEHGVPQPAPESPSAEE